MYSFSYVLITKSSSSSSSVILTFRSKSLQKILEFNKPKKPMSAFMLFASKRRQEMGKKSDAGGAGGSSSSSSSGDLALKVSEAARRANEKPAPASENDLVSKVLSFAGAFLGTTEPRQPVHTQRDLSEKNQVPSPPAPDYRVFDSKVISSFVGLHPEAVHVVNVSRVGVVGCGRLGLLNSSSVPSTSTSLCTIMSRLKSWCFWGEKVSISTFSKSEFMSLC
jgi:hypothetical protein